MDLFEKLLSQLAAVQDVWLQFLLAVAIVSVIVWRAVAYAYSTRLTNADSTQALLERQLQEYKDKLSGATPDEAKARIEALTARVDALEPRKVGADQRAQMIPILDPLRGSHIDIASEAGAANAAQLGRGLVHAFNSAGWIVRNPMVMGVRNPPMSGVGLLATNVAALTPAESAVASALQAAGLEFDIQPNHLPTHDDMPRVNLVLSHRLED